MNAEISVVIPVFNGQAHIARAIDSVMEQTLAPAEIIVVNDGSTDDTLDVLQRFGSRLTIVTTPNRGVSRARNAGIKKAKHGLIAFLDADDEWHADKLQKQVDFLADWPQAGFCCCDYTYQDRGMPETTYFTFLARIKAGSPAAWTSNPLLGLVGINFVGTTSTVLAKRDLLNTLGGFDPRYRQAEDYDLWIRCARRAQVAVMPDVLVRKIRHTANLTNNTAETLHFHELVLEEHRQRKTFDACLRGPSELIFALARTRYQIANVCFQHKQYRNCVRYCRKALLTDLSFRNVRLFLYYLSRKLLRLLSFGLVRTQ